METNTTGTTGTTSGTTTQLADVKQELASDAKTLTSAARGKVEEKATAGKETATQAARDTSSALETAVDALREKGDSPEWLTQALDKTARELDRLASSFEGKDMRTITNDVTAFARRSPVAFLAASAAVGFVAARFLRAGSDHGSEQASGADTVTTSGGADNASVATSGFADGGAEDRSTFAFDDDAGLQSSSFEGAGR